MAINFMYNTPQNGTLGGVDIGSAIQQGIKTYSDLLSAQAKPRALSEELLAARLGNQIKRVTANHAEENALADLSSKNFANKSAEVASRYAEPNAQADLTGKGLQNQIAGTNLQYLPDGLKAQIAQSLAASNLSNTQANLLSKGPGITKLTGAASDIASIRALEQQLGSNNPDVIAAREQFKLKQESQAQRNNYTRSLMNTADKKSATQLGKLIQEEAEVDAGYEPGSGKSVRISPERQQELKGQYQLQTLKTVSNPEFQKLAGAAKQIDKTLNALDVDKLVQYAGIEGAAAKKWNDIKAPFALESQDYRDFKKNVNLTHLLADQVRKFYGASIQPDTVKGLEHLANTASWRNNPELAKELFLTFKAVLENESSTYINALKSTKELLGESSKNNNSISNMKFDANKLEF